MRDRISFDAKSTSGGTVILFVYGRLTLRLQTFQNSANTLKGVAFSIQYWTNYTAGHNK